MTASGRRRSPDLRPSRGKHRSRPARGAAWKGGRSDRLYQRAPRRHYLAAQGRRGGVRPTYSAPARGALKRRCGRPSPPRGEMFAALTHAVDRSDPGRRRTTASCATSRVTPRVGMLLTPSRSAACSEPRRCRAGGGCAAGHRRCDAGAAALRARARRCFCRARGFYARSSTSTTCFNTDLPRGGRLSHARAAGLEAPPPTSRFSTRPSYAA